MKNLNKFISLVILTICLVSCQDETKFGDVIAPTNLNITAEIIGQDAENPYGDGSGEVLLTATADNALSYRFLGPGFQEDASNGEALVTFSNQGVNTYQVTVLAYGTGGVSSSAIIEVEVQVNYSPPTDLLEKLVGDGTKTWRIKSEKDKHFGLGPPGGLVNCEWYGAGPEEKAGVGMYDDRFVFSMNWDTMEDRVFQHITDNTNDDNNGTVFGRDGFIQELNGPCPSCEMQGADVLNYPLSDYNATWQILAPGGVETLALSSTAFIGYYTGGNHRYQIVDRSVPNELLLATIDGNGEFTWWFTITDVEPDSGEFESDYNNLVWEDNFDTNGAPNAAKWTYDLGTGSNGWGNNESQTYTNSSNNVIVEDGVLKITAIATGGGNYTSARIKTENLFEFTYGRVEVRAKLPVGGGTWPAIWMLGANYETLIWPACGEIDIMEHVGNNQNQIHGTLHYPGNSGGNANGASTTVPTASSEFHNYTVDWSPTAIRILVDDVLYFTFPNTATTPFNNDFFIILNVAMGGNFGGSIDPNFSQSTFEIDYVRVYQ